MLARHGSLGDRRVLIWRDRAVVWARCSTNQDAEGSVGLEGRIALHPIGLAWVAASIKGGAITAVISSDNCVAIAFRWRA